MKRITGTIYTGLLSPAITDALLMGDDGRILATGEDAKRVRSAGIEETALGRRVATPGFIDAHMHLEFLVQKRMHLQLDDARSLDELLSRVAARAKSIGPGRPLIGSGWDEGDWDVPRVPTRDDLDRAAPRHAVMLRRVCGHLWSVNSETLRLIGERGDLTEHQLERLKAVEADGILRETDTDLARPLARPTDEELGEHLTHAMRDALACGATCIHDVGAIARAFVDLDAKTTLPCRIVASVRPGDVEDMPLDEVRGRFSGRRVHPGPVKIFLDGSIGAQTAALAEPFADDPGNMGMLLWNDDDLLQTVERYHAAGLQLALHAIGERAIDQALDVYERVLERHPRDDHRHRIEHLELVIPEQIERMRALGVIASMQPNFLRWHNPGGLYDRRLGDRTPRLNPLRGVLDAGVPLTFGSDGMPFGPLFGIRSAMNHPTASERLTFVQSLNAYTQRAAFAGFVDRLTGTLEIGKAADVAILSRDPADGSEVKVVEVLLAGQKSFPE